MGKLHKIRRQILKDPDAWRNARDHGANAVYLKDGVWKPYWGYRHGNPYKGFVEYTLSELDFNGGGRQCR